MKILALVLSLASAVVASAQSPKPTIVLVHGAFADGSSWAKVIPILEADGYTVIAVQNPLTSLPDDIATTKTGHRRTRSSRRQPWRRPTFERLSSS
jgi:pimeloyl-ACP methyl ester carboxylesterase